MYEGRQYREAAAFLAKLPHYTLKATLPDIPVDLLIETLPHSLSLLEALYSRLLELSVNDAKMLRVEQVLWRIVHLISLSQDHFRSRVWSKLLVSLNGLAPNAGRMLAARKRALERAVEGLGKHGLVALSCHSTNLENGAASNLVPLPFALKEQLENRIEAYKLAVHKIESFGKQPRTHRGNFRTVVPNLRISIEKFSYRFMYVSVIFTYFNIPKVTVLITFLFTTVVLNLSGLKKFLRTTGVNINDL